MPTTLAFPYPDSSDDLRLGAAAIQALAEAVDDYFVGSTANPTAGASIGLGTTKVHRRGSIAILQANFSSTGAIGAGATVLTLPAGYRPTATSSFMVTNVNTGASHMLNVFATGVITANAALPTGGAFVGVAAIPL